MGATSEKLFISGSLCDCDEFVIILVRPERGGFVILRIVRGSANCYYRRIDMKDGMTLENLNLR